MRQVTEPFVMPTRSPVPGAQAIVWLMVDVTSTSRPSSGQRAKSSAPGAVGDAGAVVDVSTLGSPLV